MIEDITLLGLVALAAVGLLVTQARLRRAERRIAELERIAGILYPWD